MRGIYHQNYATTVEIGECLQLYSLSLIVAKILYSKCFMLSGVRPTRQALVILLANKIKNLSSRPEIFIQSKQFYSEVLFTLSAIAEILETNLQESAI